MNFDAVTTTAATPVRIAPKPLRASLNRHPVGRVSHQCRTMPACDNVNPTNTPIANSGTSVFMSPRAPISSTAETSVRNPIP